jgi:arylsulfatase A-like enzyme
VFSTSDNAAWQDVYPDAGYTPFRGTKGAVREGVSSIAWGPGIKPGPRNYDIVGGLDYMATFVALAGVRLPDRDREGKPIMGGSPNLVVARLSELDPFLRHSLEDLQRDLLIERSEGCSVRRMITVADRN